MIHWKRKRLQPSFQLHLMEENYNQSCNLLLFIMVVPLVRFVVSSDKKYRERKFQKLTDLCQFKEVAEAWERVDHEYNKINEMVDWQDFAEKWAHKACKGKFFKKEFLARQMQLSVKINYLQKKINRTTNQ